MVAIFVMSQKLQIYTAYDSDVMSLISHISHIAKIKTPGLLLLLQYFFDKIERNAFFMGVSRREWTGYDL